MASAGTSVRSAVVRGSGSGVGSAVRESGGVGFLAFRGFFAVEDIMEGTNHKNQRQKDAKGNDDAFIDISGYLFFSAVC